MSDSHHPPPIDLPQLEEHSPAHRSAGTNTLFPDDSVAAMVSKVHALESMLELCTRDLKFQDFMRETLLTVMEVVKSEAGSILELDSVNRCFFFRAVAGQSSDRVNHFVVPWGQGIVGHVAESRQPLVVNNVDENKIHLKALAKAVGFETRNMVALPILVRGEIFGVIELLNRVGEDDYTPTDIDTLTYVCSAMAKAIEIRLMIGWALNKSGSDKISEAA